MEPIPREKISHSAGVAEYMYANAYKYDLNPEKMYVLGLLHDIGYIQGCREGHEKYGAEMLRTVCGLNGLDSLSMYHAIKGHGEIPREYEDFNSYWPGNRERWLLLSADMQIDHLGNWVGYEGGLRDIAERYGEDSKTFICAERLVEWLERTEPRKDKKWISGRNAS